jgi:hypothetical protein
MLAVDLRLLSHREIDRLHERDVRLDQRDSWMVSAMMPPDRVVCPASRLCGPAALPASLCETLADHQELLLARTDDGSVVACFKVPAWAAVRRLVCAELTAAAYVEPEQVVSRTG